MIECVLECELMALEGLVYDEGPYGEFTGRYGGGIKNDYRLKVMAMTYRKSGIDMREVRCPLGGLSNIAYAKINPLDAGDSRQALGIASKIGMDCTMPLGPEWNPNEFARPPSWEAKPQPVNHSDPRHIRATA